MALQNLRPRYGRGHEKHFPHGESEFALRCRARTATARSSPQFHFRSSSEVSISPPHIEELPDEHDLSKEFRTGQGSCLARATNGHSELTEHESASKACGIGPLTPPVIRVTIDGDSADDASSSGESDSSSVSLTAYEVLGVATDATRHVIKKAFKSKQATFKEIRAKAVSDEAYQAAQNHVRLLEEVYTTLRDIATRAAYDKLIGLSEERPDSSDQEAIAQIVPTTAQYSALTVKRSSTPSTLPQDKPLEQIKPREIAEKRSHLRHQEAHRPNNQLPSASRQHLPVPQLQHNAPPRLRDYSEPKHSLAVVPASPSEKSAVVPLQLEQWQQTVPRNQVALANRQTQLQSPALRQDVCSSRTTSMAESAYTRAGSAFLFPPFPPPHKAHRQSTAVGQISAPYKFEPMKEYHHMIGFEPALGRRQVGTMHPSQMIAPAPSQAVQLRGMVDMSMMGTRNRHMRAIADRVASGPTSSQMIQAPYTPRSPSFPSSPGFGHINDFSFIPAGTLTTSRTQTNVVVNAQTGIISGLQQSDRLYRDGNGNLRMEQDRKEFTRRS